MPSAHEGHNGFELAASARNICLTNKQPSLGSLRTMLAIPSKRLIYCPMEKIGSTFWTRFFYMLSAKNSASYKHPYEVPIKTALDNTQLFNLRLSALNDRNILSKSAFSFLFVRDPFSRLLSAFIDKLVAPNPTYWKFFGIKSILAYRHTQHLNISEQNKLITGTLQRNDKIDGHDVTFPEFIKHVVSSEITGRNLDSHFTSTFRSCKPCASHFSYIGRMETFQDDALFIMKKMGMNSSIDALEKVFNKLTVDDAIMDSIYGPFGWKSTIEEIISWEKALKRIWLKLQMRGIIALKQTFPLSPNEIINISADDFINIARTAHKISDPEELKGQKSIVKKEAFASVPLEDVIAFRNAFRSDIEIFGYTLSPDYIFDRGYEPKQPSVFFNYSHLN